MCLFRIIPLCLLFTLHFSLFTIHAQRSLVIYGKLTDAETNQAVSGSPVTIDKYYLKTISNYQGFYYLSVTLPKDTREISLQVKDVRYETKIQVIGKRKLNKAVDSLRVDFSLVYFTLPDVNITGEPAKAYGNRQHHVADYEFWKDKLVLLTYEKKMDKGCRLLLCNENNRVFANMLVPGTAKELHRDFQGNIHLICEDKVYNVNVYDTTMGLVPIEKNFFTENIKPLVDTGNNHIYFSNFLDIYPAFDYFAFSPYDSTYKKLRHLIDKPLMDLYRAQFKYVSGRDKLEAYRAELRTGIDKEIWVAIWSGFPQSIYYKPLYAPMFLKEDTVLIFDHYSNRLFRYNSKHEVIDSIEINYHQGTQGKEWEQQLLKDYSNEKIYGVFQRAGKFYVKELNTQTGEISSVFGLHYKYPEKIKVHNGYVYYIYRPFESTQTRFLYKEKIASTLTD